eukprot:3890889-Pyramimonas_sp.AAC.1
MSVQHGQHISVGDRFSRNQARLCSPEYPGLRCAVTYRGRQRSAAFRVSWAPPRLSLARGRFGLLAR